MKYLTKGELLTTLGSSANNFTAFLMNPEGFGVTEPTLTMLRVAKQKLDWTNSIDLELEEIPMLIGMLVQYGVVTQSDADAVMNTPDRKDGDMYLITVKAQDDITVENIYGAINVGNHWSVTIDLINKTKNEIITLVETFDVIPTQEMITSFVNTRIVELKRVN